MGANVAETEQSKKPRNWWKYGCVVALVLFEITREFAVLSGAEAAQPSALKSVGNYNGYVSARGRWWRVNGESEIVPGTVTIECSPTTQECIEASVAIFDKRNVMPPEIDHFPARWDQSSVSYVNDNPTCARYSVRIDWVAQRAIATRIRKDDAKDEFCKSLEPRLDMELGDGFKNGESAKVLDEHFVPAISAIAWIAKSFGS